MKIGLHPLHIGPSDGLRDPRKLAKCRFAVAWKHQVYPHSHGQPEFLKEQRAMFAKNTRTTRLCYPERGAERKYRLPYLQRRHRDDGNHRVYNQPGKMTISELSARI